MSVTPTEVVVGSDVESITHLDDDWEVACEIPQRNQRHPGGWPDCQGDPARWIARAICDCNTPGKPGFTLLCDHCKSVYEEWARLHGHFSCTWCEKGGLKPPVPWFERLHKA